MPSPALPSSRATHGCLRTKAPARKGPAGFPLREARALALRRYTAARHPRTSCVTVPRAGLRFPPRLLPVQGHAHWRAQVPRPVEPSGGPDWRARALQSQWRSRMPLATPLPGARARDRTVPLVRAPGSPPPSCALLPAAAAACNLRRQDVAGG